MTYIYQAFGMTIRSEIELPELSAGMPDGACDVSIRLAGLGLADTAAAAYHHFSPDRQTFVYPRIGAFVINGLDEVVVEPAQGSTPSLMALPLLGPVMGLLLHLRGRFVLHGSAVAIDGKGFGFVGDKGAGKSTLAAALVGKGATFLSDDLLVFDEAWRILPAFPQLKLSPEAAEVTRGVNATLMPPPVEGFPKKQLRLAAAMPITPVHANGVFEIRRRPEAGIDLVESAEALKSVLRFSYVVRFTKRSMEPAERQRLFSQAASLTRATAIGRFFVPGEIEQLASVRQLLAAQ